MQSGNVNWRKASLVAGTIGAVLGIMISWEALEFLPRWAWYTEVAAVQEFAVGTRMLVLGQEWERLDKQIRSLEDKARTSAEDDSLSKLKNRQREVEAQLNQLQAAGEAVH